MKIKKNKTWAFTLIEMLVVMAMLGVISLAVYSTLSNGVKVWRRLEGAVSNEDINIFFDKFTADVGNSFKYGNIAFTGTDIKFSFPTMVISKRMDKNTVGNVIYTYNRYGGILDREVKDYSNVYSQDEGEKRTIAKGISSLKFTYYVYDKENKEYIWQEDMKADGKPIAVRVELKLQDDVFTRTVNVPTTDLS